MTLFIIFISLIVIGMLLMILGVFHGMDEDGDFVSEVREWSFACGFVFALFGIGFGVIFGICAMCANSKRYNEEKLIEYRNKRDNIVFLLTTATQDNIVKISKSVEQYNYDIEVGQKRNQRPITSWITYDIWDQLEPIDYSDYVETPKAYSLNITQNTEEDTVKE